MVADQFLTPHVHLMCFPPWFWKQPSTFSDTGCCILAHCIISVPRSSRLVFFATQRIYLEFWSPLQNINILHVYLKLETWQNMKSTSTCTTSRMRTQIASLVFFWSSKPHQSFISMLCFTDFRGENALLHFLNLPQSFSPVTTDTACTFMGRQSGYF